MSHHFWSPSAASCVGLASVETVPRYKPGTATVGRLEFGPTVQPEASRATLNKRMGGFILVSLGGCAFGSREQLVLLGRAGPLFDQIKHGGYEENADETCSQHSADDGCAHDLASYSPRAGSGPQRDRAQNECERSHQDWAKPQTRSFEGRVRQGLTLFILFLRKFHDQNRVLCCQSNQHHQADLRIDIAFDLHHIARQKCGEKCSAQPQNEECTEYRDGCTEKHAKGKRPTFVQSSENQEHEQKGESENSCSRDTFTRFLLLERHAEVVKANLARHRFPKDVFKSVHCLLRAVARSGGTIDLCGAVLVESHREFGAIARLKAGDGSERHHSALVVSHIKLPDILRP